MWTYQLTFTRCLFLSTLFLLVSCWSNPLISNPFHFLFPLRFDGKSVFYSYLILSSNFFQSSLKVGTQCFQIKTICVWMNWMIHWNKNDHRWTNQEKRKTRNCTLLIFTRNGLSVDNTPVNCVYVCCVFAICWCCYCAQTPDGFDQSTCWTELKVIWFTVSSMPFIRSPRKNAILFAHTNEKLADRPRPHRTSTLPYCNNSFHVTPPEDNRETYSTTQQNTIALRLYVCECVRVFGMSARRCACLCSS